MVETRWGPGGTWTAEPMLDAEPRRLHDINALGDRTRAPRVTPLIDNAEIVPGCAEPAKT